MIKPINYITVRNIIMLTGVCILTALFSCSKDEKPSQPEEPINDQIVNKVLIIGIDGCRPDAIEVANTPNLDALMANGTYSLDARNTGITMSGPGWSSMLSGVWDNKHNVTNNSYSGSNFTRYPHFFKYVENANPNYRTVSIVEWNPINDYQASLEADVAINADADGGVKNAAANELIKNDPTVMFLQFSNVDYAGHGTGFSTTNPDYINAIETVDSQIGGVLDALKSRKTYDKENWVIILSTDHGGIGTSDGGDTDEERTIFFIVSGDAVPNKEIAKTTTQITVPPVENCFNSDSELQFNGDTVIEIGNKADYNFGSSQDFSIECRIRSKIPADVGVLGKKNWDNGGLPGYVFSFKPSTKNFRVNVGDGVNRVDVDAGIITDNEWHTVSATFDRDGMLKVYVDGTLTNSASMASIGNMDNSLPFTIGADGNLNYKYNGYLAEVRVFNTLLGASDIENWNCKTLDNTHSKNANLIGYWKMVDGSGTNIDDSSANNNDGTLSGGLWKDATASTIETVSNYDNTPRTIDVVKTALNHLCIPVQDSWGIEGKSLIGTSCEN